MARSSSLINSPRSRGIGVVLSFVFVGPGCQFAFGTYAAGTGDAGVMTTGGIAGIGGAPSSSGGAAAGGSTDYGPCDGNTAYKCDVNNLLRCENNRWKPKDLCTKAAYCEPSLGICYKCATDEPTQCLPAVDGGIGVSSCIDPVVGFATPTDACKPGLYCVPGIAYCVACETDETHCTTSAFAKVCNRTRTDFSDAGCSGGCITTEGKPDVCLGCIEGSTACSDSAGKRVLRTCHNGAWSTTDCAKDCQDAVGANPAACVN